MAKILNCKRPDTSKASQRPMILVTTAGRDIWITQGQWKASGASAALDNYVGGNIDFRFFEEGESLFDGTPCTASDKILDTFSVSMNPKVLAESVVIEAERASEKADDMASLYARRRAEKKAKAEAITAVVEPVAVVEAEPIVLA